MYQFALVTEARDVSVKDLYHLKGALEINARHCAEAWNKVPPAIDVFDNARKLPYGCHMIKFVDDSAMDPGALAVHYWDPLRMGPAARVYVDRASGFNKGRFSVAEGASHEVTEALIDPMVNLWVPHPHPDWRANGRDVEIALEVADMVQTHYMVKLNGAEWQMTNFCNPHYFMTELADAPAETRLEFIKHNPLDFKRELTMPGEIGPEGYAILRERHPEGGWRIFTTDASGQERKFAKAEGKAHPWARTRRRGVQIDV